jgi:hypothetical protein
MNEVVYFTYIKLAYNGNIVLLHSPRFWALKSTIRISVKFDITGSVDPSDRAV